MTFIFYLIDSIISKKVDHKHEVTALCISDQLDLLISGDRSGAIHTHNFQKTRGAPVYLHAHKTVVTSIQMAPDHRMFLSTDDRGLIIAWFQNSRDQATLFSPVLFLNITFFCFFFVCVFLKINATKHAN